MVSIMSIWAFIAAGSMFFICSAIAPGSIPPIPPGCTDRPSTSFDTFGGGRAKHEQRRAVRRRAAASQLPLRKRTSCWRRPRPAVVLRCSVVSNTCQLTAAVGILHRNCSCRPWTDLVLLGASSSSISSMRESPDAPPPLLEPCTVSCSQPQRAGGLQWWEGEAEWWEGEAEWWEGEAESTGRSC